MSPDEFRDCLDALGLKQTGERGADKFLGVKSPVTIRRWARGNAQAPGGGIPDAVAMLLRIMVAKRIKPEGARALLTQPMAKREKAS